MVGQIGGLARAGNPSVTNAAADLARVWTAGWAAKDRTPLEKALAEIVVATKQNQAVVDQATAALKELSAGRKALEEGQAEFHADKAKWQSDLAVYGKRLADQETALDAKRRATELELLQREVAVAEREKSVAAREAGVKICEKANDRLKVETLHAAAAAAKAREEADAIKAGYEARVAATKKIWA